MTVWLGAGLATGCILVLSYLVLAGRRRRRPELPSAIRLMLAGIAAQAGTKIVYLAIVSSEQALAPFDGDDRVYVLFGGFALLWVSLADSYRELTRATTPDHPRKPAQDGDRAKSVAP